MKRLRRAAWIAFAALAWLAFAAWLVAELGLTFALAPRWWRRIP